MSYIRQSKSNQSVCNKHEMNYKKQQQTACNNIMVSTRNDRGNKMK